jgi:hypothetical protein
MTTSSTRLIKIQGMHKTVYKVLFHVIPKICMLCFCKVRGFASQVVFANCSSVLWEAVRFEDSDVRIERKRSLCSLFSSKENWCRLKNVYAQIEISLTKYWQIYLLEFDLGWCTMSPNCGFLILKINNLKKEFVSMLKLPRMLQYLILSLKKQNDPGLYVRNATKIKDLNVI